MRLVLWHLAKGKTPKSFKVKFPFTKVERELEMESVQGSGRRRRWQNCGLRQNRISDKADASDHNSVANVHHTDKNGMWIICEI